MKSFYGFVVLMLCCAIVGIQAVRIPLAPQASLPPPPPFNCPALPQPPPATNVNELRPGNIQVIMAVGDSISAGFAMHADHAYNLLEFGKDLVEYRGDVFSIGGNPDQYTLPNFLMHYNPNLIGASIGNTLPLDAVDWEHHIIQPFDPRITHLNGAQSMARIDQVPSQVDYITQQLLTTYNDTVDMENDWKMMTIFIGANNICPACSNRSDTQPGYYEDQMNGILEQIYNQIPRTFVNIVTMFNISQVWTVHETSDYCRFMWDTFCKSECGCITDNSTEKDRLMMDMTSMAFNERIYKVAEEWQAKNIPTFTVKVQPFTQNLTIPADLGLDFLSRLDCFHPSAYADAAFAIGLWNNLMGNKTTITVTDADFICPDENTFLQ
eukprot:TRINITY_DN5093_c0_g1_i1.p1 TRINITY_DN5093_c0_g1~~TRINITY_DN5093_c0_g1_i1.p1  ORF type:complete len:381 (-),score=87.81 TRINITY_DN5093_c0_g1_i1:96-1238(-)